MLDYFKKLLGRNKKRSFQAAIANRLTGGWGTTPTPINVDLRQNYTGLVARVRDLAQNNDYVRRYLALSRSNIVGPKGVIVQSRVPSRTMRGSIDNLAAEAVEDAWKEWGRHGICDVTGVHSWVSLQNSFITDVLRDGEALYRKIPGYTGNEFGFALRRLDPMSLPPDYDVEHSNGNRVLMGVELDDLDRPVAYHLLQQRASDRTYFRDGSNFERVPAEQIIHRFLPEFAYQTRGFSPMCSAMVRLKMLGAYEEASVTKARIAASVMGFFTRSEDGLGYGNAEGSNVDGSLNMGVEPGVFKELPEGVGLEMFDPKAPHENYGEFVKATLRGIASGLGVSYNNLANDLENVNFSSIRTSTLEDRESWKCIQEWMIEVFVRPVFEDFARMALLSGAIKINGQLPRSDPQRYMKASYQARRWAWVDPVKDAEASRLLINERLTTRSDVIREMGKDPQEVWDKIAEEEALMEQLGIQPKDTPDGTDET